MTTRFKNISINWSIVQLVLFLVGVIMACIPLFSMDYLVTLDGPNHLYSSKTFMGLTDGKEFYEQYFHLNEHFTPNYFTVFVLGILQTIFTGSVALKVFHLLHLVLLISGAYFWVNSHQNDNTSYPFLILPFVYSYLFFSGFYNFIFAVSISLWLLGIYERFKQKEWNWKKYLLIGLLLFLTYCSHVIPFFFVGLFLFVDLIIEWKKADWGKHQLYHGMILFACALPGLILTILFMGSRESTYGYLEFNELVSKISSGFSIVIKHDSPEHLETINWIKLVYLAIALMLFLYSFFSSKDRNNLSLIIACALILVLYFSLPDSTGYASVFSVRIEYIFWLFIVIGASRLVAKNNYTFLIQAIAGIGLLTFQISTNLPYWKMLNGHAKSVVSACDYIEDQSVVYPVFNSLIWDDYHISNFLGTEDKDLLILENSSARQDYFPLIYNAPYEDCLRETANQKFVCGEQKIEVDYLLIIGKYILDQNDTLATKLYSKAYHEGEIVYEDDFLQLLKLP